LGGLSASLFCVWKNTITRHKKAGSQPAVCYLAHVNGFTIYE
jgi:hypothetical protein